MSPSPEPGPPSTTRTRRPCLSGSTRAAGLSGGVTACWSQKAGDSVLCENRRADRSLAQHASAGAPESLQAASWLAVPCWSLLPAAPDLAGLASVPYTLPSPGGWGPCDSPLHLPSNSSGPQPLF